MNQCPMHKVRADLPPLTKRIAALPVDERGYPVPFFVAWPNGKPDFRMADPDKIVACVKCKLCWTCGQPLGAHLAFPIGPMCAVNRTTAEPPSHLECALWSVKGCPFLSRPGMVRREDDRTREGAQNVPGMMIKRNPGVILVWVTKRYDLFPDGRGGVLFKVGEPEALTWWREGRPATRQECLESIQSGEPLLREACGSDLGELVALGKAVDRAMELLPA